MLEVTGFITNLGKYVEGELVGEWVTFPIDEQEQEEIFKRIGINEEYEEYFFTDWEGYNFGEYVNIDELNEIAETLDSYDDNEIAKLEAILEAETSDIRQAIEYMDSYEFYEGVTLYDYAVDLVEDCYNLPEFAQRYFDYDALARDLSFEGYHETSEGVLYNC